MKNTTPASNTSDMQSPTDKNSIKTGCACGDHAHEEKHECRGGGHAHEDGHKCCGGGHRHSHEKTGGCGGGHAHGGQCGGGRADSKA